MHVLDCNEDLAFGSIRLRHVEWQFGTTENTENRFIVCKFDCQWHVEYTTRMPHTLSLSLSLSHTLHQSKSYSILASTQEALCSIDGIESPPSIGTGSRFVVSLLNHTADLLLTLGTTTNSYDYYNNNVTM
jgi:hypothetical protein